MPPRATPPSGKAPDPDIADIADIAKDGSRRSMRGYHAVAYDIRRGCAIGYMPGLNVLSPIGDNSPQSDQPMMKHLTVEVGPATATPNG